MSELGIMIENQYILKLQGLLDIPVVDRLLGKIEGDYGSPTGGFQVDCTDLEDVLFEALQHLNQELKNRGNPLDYNLEFFNLSEKAAFLFQMLGMEVRERRVVFGVETEQNIQLTEEDLIPVKEETQERKRGEAICPGCKNILRIPSMGSYKCPHCGIRFHMDKLGNIGDYERPA